MAEGLFEGRMCSSGDSLHDVIYLFFLPGNILFSSSSSVTLCSIISTPRGDSLRGRIDLRLECVDEFVKILIYL